MTRLLVDAGPLLAAFSEADQWYEWSRRQISGATQPLLTCESVLSEAAFLFRRQTGDPAVLMRALQDGYIRVEFQLGEHIREVSALMKRFRDVPISLADACLIRMTELFPDSQLITADRDFLIYRRFGRQLIPLIAPWQE